MPEGHTIHRAAREQTGLLARRRVSVSSPQGRFSADAQRIDGTVLERVEAVGKHLFYHWESGEIGHVHLGLFGKFRVQQGADTPDPRGAVRMRLSTEETTVDLSGPTVCSLDPPSVRAEILARLGPDPLRRNTSPGPMFARIERSQRAIGDLLMDQSVVAGIGNVYRAEALFVAGIHPLRQGSQLDEGELEVLWEIVSGMLRAGRRTGRIVTVDRAEIGLAPRARIPREEATYVYKRDRCVRCGNAIRTIEIAGRTCYYCPTDQPA